MTSKEIRDKFLRFFESKGHAIIPSASLVPSDTDPTVLFNIAGMQPLMPYLLGEKHPKGDKLTDSQKCIRTIDIEEVGDANHLTFFEMLGNWSLDAYFKEEAIKMSWEFLVSPDWLGIDPKKIAVSVFAGDEDAPFDEEAFDFWKKIGMPEERIAKLGKEDNWWGPAGETGPCGPDTEMFYWTGEDPAPEKFDPENNFWMEIWNDVFMQYNKTPGGKYEPLGRNNVDTGMGLERITMALQGKNSVYETDLFEPIMNKINDLATEDDIRSKRIIADHVKASVFIIADGTDPSNTGRGYVVRRLIRRAIRYGKLLGIKDDFIVEVAKVVTDTYKDIYPEIENNEEKIFEELFREEEKFVKVIQDGLKKSQKIFDKKTPLSKEVYSTLMQSADKDEIFKKMYQSREESHKKGLSSESTIANMKNDIYRGATISGKEAFDLYQTNGFPIEMIIELAQEKHLIVDVEDFQNELKKHQELSKSASVGMFKGGLADDGEMATKYHTATHLLLAALREVLGPETIQKGSNITPERLRFDFNYPQKLTDEQKQKIEEIINAKIKENIPVEMEEMSKEEALKIAKVSFDTSKYGDKVKVYKIGDPSNPSGQAFSIELCGGPHVKSTDELGDFKIKKEEASSAGVRRIKAVLS